MLVSTVTVGASIFAEAEELNANGKARANEVGPPGARAVRS